MRRMLINARKPEELRIAIVNDTTQGAHVPSESQMQSIGELFLTKEAPVMGA